MQTKIQRRHVYRKNQLQNAKRHNPDQHVVALYLRTYFRRFWRQHLPSQPDLSKDALTEAIHAKALAVLEACLFLRTHKRFPDCTIYQALLAEIAASNITVHPAILNLSSLQWFSRCLDEHNILTISQSHQVTYLPLLNT